MTPLNTLERGRGQNGFTMIEVLIALVYMTIGLLGIIAMEDVALSRNVDAKRITIATNLATEMLDRIRLNSPANINPLLTPPIPASPYLYHGIVACAAVIPANCAGQTYTANAGNTAGTPNGPAWGDYRQWADHFAVTDSNGQSLLPNGVGTVSSTVVGPPVLGQVQVSVTVQWNAGFRTPALTLSTIVAPL
jgi:prepilin-type N-terminal cleavage/methylation domain-containing protein